MYVENHTKSGTANEWVGRGQGTRQKGREKGRRTGPVEYVETTKWGFSKNQRLRRMLERKKKRAGAKQERGHKRCDHEDKCQKGDGGKKESKIRNSAATKNVDENSRKKLKI